MCGIAGLATSRYDHVSLETVLNDMLDAIYHRGPDDGGLNIADGVGIGMRRLSIIDVSGGHQPIFNEDNSVCIVFNGEIYNHEKLRSTLKNKGHAFKTRTDTEVILHLYEEYGEDCVLQLRGMFAFAIHDLKNKKLFIARDRIGIKPLFYHFNGQSLVFASEIKSILKTRLYDRKLDYKGMDYFFTLGYIPCPHTIYEGINKLEPAHILTYQDGKLAKRQYWDLTYRVDHDKCEDEYAEEFLAQLKQAVRLHLMSEVPLGVFLSGGIDSSLLVALMSEMTSSKIKTFTMGFGGNIGGYTDERALAKQIADRYKTDHVELVCEPNVTELLDTLAKIFDEPFSDDSIIPTYHICKMASKEVTVALTGLGGDELFGGYERYLGLKFSRIFNKAIPYSLRKNLVVPVISRLKEQKSGDYKINHLKRFAKNSLLSENRRYFGYMSILDKESKDLFYARNIRDILDYQSEINVVTDSYNKNPGNDYLQKATYCDFQSYLPEDILAMSDRISMHHSMELRVPFVDHEVVEYSAGIPSGLKIKGIRKKYLLRKIAGQYLPDNIIKHKKQGFASPMTAWLKHDLKNVVRERLGKEEIMKHNYFNFPYVQKKIEDHMNGRDIHDKLLFSLLVFQTWYNENY